MTEREITNGILNVFNVKRQCLAYFRQINRIDTSDTGVVDKFIDITSKGDIDKEAQTLLNDLRDKRLIAKLSPPNLAKYIHTLLLTSNYLSISWILVKTIICLKIFQI